MPLRGVLGAGLVDDKAGAQDRQIPAVDAADRPVRRRRARSWAPSWAGQAAYTWHPWTFRLAVAPPVSSDGMQWSCGPPPAVSRRSRSWVTQCSDRALIPPFFLCHQPPTQRRAPSRVVGKSARRKAVSGSVPVRVPRAGAHSHDHGGPCLLHLEQAVKPRGEDLDRGGHHREAGFEAGRGFRRRQLDPVRHLLRLTAGLRSPALLSLRSRQPLRSRLALRSGRAGRSLLTAQALLAARACSPRGP